MKIQTPIRLGLKGLGVLILFVPERTSQCEVLVPVEGSAGPQPRTKYLKWLRLLPLLRLFGKPDGGGWKTTKGLFPRISRLSGPNN